MRDRDDAARSILRVALGDLQLAESRSAEAFTDQQAEGVIRKLIKSNTETIEFTRDEAVAERLRHENQVLESLLPRTLSVEQIIAALEPVEAQIRGAGNDGQATGAAMKHLKSTDANVVGSDVAQAVRQMRG